MKSLLILTGLFSLGTVLCVLRDRRRTRRFWKNKISETEKNFADKERGFLSKVRTLESEIASRESENGTLRLRCDRFERALALVREVVPIVTGLAQTVIDKSEQGSTALTEQVFSLAERSCSLSEMMAEFLSSMTDGNGSLETTLVELQLNINSLDHARDLHTQADTSLKRYIALINTTVSDSTLLLSQIGEIAQLTNLLAINASIYAARAGKHGQGFGVIAGEIQKLSETTEEVSKTITVNTQEIKSVFADFAEAHRSFMESSQTSLGEAAASLEATISKLQPKVHQIGDSVRDATEMSEFVTGRLNSISEEMQGHDAIQQIVTHITKIVDETAQEAHTWANRKSVDGPPVDPEFDPEKTVQSITARHLTMKEEYTAVGHNGYDSAGKGSAVLANGTKLNGDVTLF